MNILASPYYLEAGGTVIDWWPIRGARKRKRRLEGLAERAGNNL
jgi:hypothetical protein